MMNWIKGFFKGLKEEIFMKTQYPGTEEIDTFFWWMVYLVFCFAFYFCIYFFDEKTPAVDEWLHQNFDWDYPDPTPPEKVEWHRLVAGIMTFLGVLKCTSIYFRHLYFRIKARIAKSKAEAQDSL